MAINNLIYFRLLCSSFGTCIWAICWFVICSSRYWPWTHNFDFDLGFWSLITPCKSFWTVSGRGETAKWGTCTNGRFLILATGNVLTVVVAPLFLLRYFFKIHNKNVIKTNKGCTMKKEIGGIHGMSFMIHTSEYKWTSKLRFCEGQNRKLLKLDFTGFPRSRTKKKFPVSRGIDRWSLL